MPDCTELCNGCAGEGELCFNCGKTKYDCECRTYSPVMCDECDGEGELDIEEEK